MSKQCKFIATAILGMVFGLQLPVLAASPESSAAVEKGWEIVQDHTAHRKIGLQIRSDGIRLNSLVGTWAIVCCAPKWDAVVFSRFDGTIIHLPYSRWSKNGFTMFDATDEMAHMPKSTMAEKKLLKVGSKTNLPVIISRWNAPGTSLGGMLFRSKAAPKLCTYTLITSPAIKIPNQGLEIIRQFYKLPVTEDLVLRLQSSGDPRPMVDTLGLNETELSRSIFDVPKNLKEVKTELEIWVNPHDKQKINDFGELLGAPEK